MISDLCKWFALTLESMCPTSTHTHTHSHTHTQNYNINSTIKSKVNQKQITTRTLDQTNKLEKENTSTSHHTNLRVKIPPSVQSSSINPITTSISTSISSAVAASQSSINALRNKSKNISNDTNHQIPEINKTKEKMKDNKGRSTEDEKDVDKNSSFRSFSLSRVPQYLSSKNIPNINNIPRQFSSNTMPFSASLNSTSPRTSPSAGPARGFKTLNSTAQPLPLSLPLTGYGISSSSSTNSSGKPFLSPPAPSSSSSSSSSSSFLSPSNPNTKISPLGNY